MFPEMNSVNAGHTARHSLFHNQGARGVVPPKAPHWESRNEHVAKRVIALHCNRQPAAWAFYREICRACYFSAHIRRRVCVPAAGSENCGNNNNYPLYSYIIFRKRRCRTGTLTSPLRHSVREIQVSVGR